MVANIIIFKLKHKLMLILFIFYISENKVIDFIILHNYIPM